MIRELKGELQAKAIADSLGLFMTKYRGVYLVGNSKGEMLAKYNIGFHSKENVFYDKELFETDACGFLVIKDKNIVDASSIEIPYNLKKCFCMFRGCLSLEIPPIIPESVKNCGCMFYGCTSLKEPPIIPKSVISCTGMFAECTSLETPPEIPEGVKDCAHMFYGCTSLKEPPHFPEHCNIVEALQGTSFERS